MPNTSIGPDAPTVSDPDASILGAPLSTAELGWRIDVADRRFDDQKPFTRDELAYLS
jgi:hypothetical protein